MAFLLSVDKISNVKFRRSAFGGYKPEDVDCFIDNVCDSYRFLCEKKCELESKINDLNKELSKYREEKECIRNAILSAQKLADASITDANNKAREIVKDASNQANDIIEHARAISKEEHNKSQKIHDEIKSFRDNLMKLYNQHINLINQISEEDLIENVSDIEISSLSNDSENCEVFKIDNDEQEILKSDDKTEENNKSDEISKEIFSNLEPDNNIFSSDYDKNSSVYKESYSSLFKL